MRGRVLIVEDDQSMGEMLVADLTRRGFAPRAHGSGEEALLAFDGEDFDAVVTDLNMRGMNGIDVCRRIVTNRPDVPVIVITAFGSMDAAIAAIRAGAYDFITKPFAVDALELALGRAIQTRALREEVKRLRRAVEEGRRFDDLVGASAPMRALFDLLDRAAGSDASVLVTGETGTGKELVAQALHRRGRRAAGPFLALNCAALPEALLESELFGHARGAFTDAKSARTGLFVQASGGTLFLDEIGDMPLELQPKLLRALEERKVRPVGGSAEVPFDARIIAATHRDLEADIEDRRFREDLYFRVNVIHIEVPPLRARGSDVLLLAQAALERFALRAEKRVRGLTSAAAERLLAYSWPGNVRELSNCIERAVALTRHEQLTVEDLPEKIRDYRSERFVVPDDEPGELVSLDEVERRYILRVMDVLAGNKALAARVLGLDRRTLYRKLERYGTGGGEPEPEPAG
jgi:two-component system response regulator HydG